MTIGVGAILHQLSGGSENAPEKYYGRKIVEADVNDERLQLKFEDGVTIKLWDDGQSCCESRYITCDDDASDLIEGTLRDIQVSEEMCKEDEEYGEHESVFIRIITDIATLVLCTHNEHNGYYGGFGLTITEE